MSDDKLKDDPDEWFRNKLDEARIEFQSKLEALIMEYATRKYGPIAKQAAKNLQVNIEITEK